jgi:hypothetical protein
MGAAGFRDRARAPARSYIQSTGVRGAPLPLLCANISPNGKKESPFYSAAQHVDKACSLVHQESGHLQRQLLSKSSIEPAELPANGMFAVSGTRMANLLGPQKPGAVTTDALPRSWRFRQIPC